MNPNAQFERDLEQWLQAEAPASAPAGFHASVMDRARTLRQRPGWATTLRVRRLGRGRGMTLLAAAALLLVGGALAAGSGLLRLPTVVPPVPSPSVVAVATASPDATSPTPRPPAFQGPTYVDLTAGMTYHATSFSQAMTFTIPDTTVELGPDAVADGKTWGGGGHNMQIRYLDFDVGFTIHDDFRIDTNLCRPDGQTQSVPATPEAVGEWLHELELDPDVGGGAIPNVVTDQPDMTVDGRVATVYDVKLGNRCDSTGHQGDVWSGRSYGHHRIYAIPTGTDTILVITWNDGDTVPQESITAIADRLVASFEFE